MRARSSLLLSLAFLPACFAQGLVTSKYENLPGVALYSHGYLLSWDSPQYTRVTLYGRDAKPAFSAPERNVDSYGVMWAVDSDGVVAGAYRPRHMLQGRIDLLDLTGSVTRTINTGSYIPQQVVFAPDHTIWTTSYNARNDGTQDSMSFTITPEPAKNWGRRFRILDLPTISHIPSSESFVAANCSTSQTIASAGTKLCIPAPAPGSKSVSQESFWVNTS